MAETKILRVRVDGERCQGHNRCCALAPELFEADELGNSRVKGDGTVSAALEPKARLAVANCPEHAVRLSHD
jgi:ferredoxin